MGEICITEWGAPLIDAIVAQTKFLLPGSQECCNLGGQAVPPQQDRRSYFDFFLLFLYAMGFNTCVWKDNVSVSSEHICIVVLTLWVLS